MPAPSVDRAAARSRRPAGARPWARRKDSDGVRLVRPCEPSAEPGRTRTVPACLRREGIASLWGMSEFHRHVQRVLAAVCALCVGILLARAAGF